jgi:hypothetical protein
MIRKNSMKMEKIRASKQKLPISVTTAEVITEIGSY